MADLLIIPSGTVQAAIVGSGFDPGRHLHSIYVVPPVALLVSGTSQVFKAYGRFDDNSTSEITSDVEWSSSTASLSMSANTGTCVLNGVVFGTAIVWASSGGLSGSSVVDVRGFLRPFIPESGTVYFHMFNDGTTPSDTVASNTWRKIGTVPLNSQSGNLPSSFGPFSTANYLAAAADYMNVSPPYTFAFVGSFGTGTNNNVMSDYQSLVGGWVLYTTGHGGKAEVVYKASTGGGAAIAVTPISGNSDTLVACVGGLSGTTWFMRFNSSSLVSSSVALPPTTSGSRGTVVGVGYGPPAAGPWIGKIAEVYLSNQTPTSASLAALYNAISSSLSGAVP